MKFGDASNEAFLTGLKKYAKVTEVTADNNSELLIKLKGYNLIIVGHHKSDESPWKPYKFNAQELSLLKEIGDQRTSNLVLCVFAKPYALSDIDTFESIDGVVMSYQNSGIARKTAEVLFGAIDASGRLPVSANADFPVNTGLQLKSLSRLGYSIPERVGLSSSGLAEVDRMVNNGIDSLMFPGAQILVARRER